MKNNTKAYEFATKPSLPGGVRGLALLLALSLPCQALASDAIVSVYSNSQGSFTIMGNNLNRMTETEIRVTYQSEEVTAPQVRSLLDRNTTQLTSQGAAGSLSISFKCTGQPCKRPFSGYVPFAIADINGTVTSLSALLRYENGTTESARVSITNPTAEQLNERKAAEVAAEEARQTVIRQEKERLEAEKLRAADQATEQKTTVPVIPSTVVSKGTPEDQRSDESGRSKSPLIVERAIDREALQGKVASFDVPAKDLSGDQSPSFSHRESVLERFRSYIGERTPENLERLFERSDDTFVQDPPVVLSDGKASLRLTVRLRNRSEKSPLFYISEATCTNLHIGTNDGVWVLNLVPKQGSMAAAVTVISGNEIIDFPLAVAPPIELFEVATARDGEAEYVRTANRLAR